MADFAINESNYRQFVDDSYSHDGELKSRGLLPRQVAHGQMSCAAPVADSDTIPDSEWLDRIADLDREKAWADDVWADSPIGTLNQDGLSYCHAFSLADAAMIQRHRQGLPYVELSASSVGAPITGYRNAGAYIFDDLKQIVEVGISTTEFVPMLTTRQGDFKQGWRENAGLHKGIEFRDGRPRDFRAFGSALLRGRCVCIGCNWWGHAITATRMKIVDAAKGSIVIAGKGIVPLILNSWGKGWGDAGRATLEGRHGVPDEWYVLEQIRAA